MTVYQLIQTKDSMVALKLIDSFDCSAHDSMYDYTYGVLTANWSFDSAYTCSNDSFSVHIESDSGKKLYQFFYNAEEIAKDIEKVAYKNKQIAPYKLMVIDACGLKLVFSTAISNGLAPYLNIHF